MADLILALDQGTTSTRAMLFDVHGHLVAGASTEFDQHLPRPGWVEHDAKQILDSVFTVIGQVLAKAQITARDIICLGITNQRETTVVWDRRTGDPIHPAIVWQDTRTAPLVESLAAEGGYGRFAATTGIPLATYFSAPKVTWILDNVDGAHAAAAKGHLAFGTIDSWLIWNLTGEHFTDVTNASRTMLLDLRSLAWDEQLCETFKIPRTMLAKIRPSGAVFGRCLDQTPLPGVPLMAVLGDQQAATFGQACFTPGMAKNTYGTGNFMLLNTGHDIPVSRHGLLATVAYQLGDERPVYALEGAIAVTGSLVQWLRDNLGIIATAGEVEQLAASVPHNGGVYFVPAFSGLFAPHWRSDARGAIVGMTRYVTAGHIARAALEATAFQTREVLAAMNADTGVRLRELRVDGGMVANNLLMQFQADLLNIKVVRPTITQTTALGAAFAAGITAGVWQDTAEVAAKWKAEHTFRPALAAQERERTYRLWRKAVTRTLDWVDEDVAAAPTDKRARHSARLSMSKRAAIRRGNRYGTRP